MTDSVLRVDAHQHFWRVADQDQPWRTGHHAAIARDFTPDDLVAAAAPVGVTRTVLVESVDAPAENDRLAAFAAHPMVAGVVAWAPLSEPDRARAELARLQLDRLSGVRCLVGRDPLEWLADRDVLALMRELAARGTAWDVVPVTAEQTQAVLALARAVPELRIVVDHLGRPPVEVGGWQPWAAQLRDLSGCPNVAVKLSVGLDVLTAWPEWSPAELRPYVGWVAECFGPQRLMLASNWPVVTLRASYAQAWSDLESAVADLFAGADRQRVLAGTAVEWYGLTALEPNPPALSLPTSPTI
jgi:L-fuconolactonase